MGLIGQVRPAIVAILQGGPAGPVQVSSGCLIHQKGFIITTDLPIRGCPGLVLTDDLVLYPYQVVGRLPEKDICLLRIDRDGSQAYPRLGSSKGLAAGHRVLVAGNPGGRGVAFAERLIANPAVAPSTQDVLEIAGLGPDQMDRFIQLDGRVTGLVGGPVIDTDGNVIGIITSKAMTEDGVNLAVPVDRIRAFFYELLAPEERGGFWTGLEVNTMTNNATILLVDPEGPAAKVGLAPGDQILAVYGRPIRDGTDWLMALVGRRPGEALVLVVGRQDHQPSRRECTVNLQPYPQKALTARQGLSEGIWYAVFRGRFSRLPDFGQLEPVTYGQASGIGLSGIEGLEQEDFALVFDGFIDVPRSGVYRIVLGSDDGSVLLLDGAPAIDNDGIHPYQEASAVRHLSAGLHHIRLGYFQRTGRADLRLRVEPDNLAGDQQPIPLRLLCD